MTIPESKRITRMNEWRQLIHERQQSGLSVRAWCQQNGIRENSYYYWLRIIREEALCEAENKNGALVSMWFTRCQAVRPARAWNNAGGNPVWKGTNQSTRSEFWVAVGNVPAALRCHKPSDSNCCFNASTIMPLPKSGIWHPWICCYAKHVRARAVRKGAIKTAAEHKNLRVS